MCLGAFARRVFYYQRKADVIFAPAHETDIYSTDPVPQFRRYPRRLNRGQSLQGLVAFFVILPFPATVGVGCMIAFIVVMARPPHDFTPTAQGLLVAFLLLYLGSALSALAWGMFLIPYLYRMWLASFDSDWVERENTGWWGRFVRMERWLGRIEHSIYKRVKDNLSSLRKVLPRRSSTRNVEPGETN
jgi:hypothetical protein